MRLSHLGATPRPPKAIVLALVTVLAAVLLVPPVAVQGTGASLTAVRQPTWQTNASVHAIGIAQGKVFVGGRFTTVRPPGAAPGSRQTTRYYLAAFDQRTGALITSFAPVLNGAVWSIAVYHTGSRIFVGGDFTRVNGQVRNRVAAFDTATGKLIADWRPSVSYRVKAMASYQNVLYLGGSFGLVNNISRPRLAAVAAHNGVLLGWQPKPNHDVYAIDVADDGSKVFAGGNFTAVNGVAKHRVAALAPYPSVGALQPFAAESAIPRLCRSVVRDIDTYGSRVFLSNAGDGSGCFDGTFAADIASGNLVWKNNCLGATEAIKAVGGWLYKGSHAHDCSRDGGFPEGAGYRYLLVQRLDNGQLGPWFPNTNTGPPTYVGPLTMAAAGYDLWVGGDFGTVNGGGQQGLTRFTNAAPGAAPGALGYPQLSNPATGQVKIRIQTTVDNDDITLAYHLVRAGKIVRSWQGNSTFWSRPWLEHTETGLPVGTHTYAVQVSDGRNVRWSPKSSITLR